MQLGDYYRVEANSHNNRRRKANKYASYALVSISQNKVTCNAGKSIYFLRHKHYFNIKIMTNEG